LLPRCQQRERSRAAEPRADLQESIRAIETVRAKIECDAEHSRTDQNTVEWLRRSDLRTAGGAVEQRKLQIVESVRRRAAISQPALICEAGCLAERRGCTVQNHVHD